MTAHEAAALLSVWGYPAYLLFFAATAIGSPITEDLLLLLGGYLIGTGVFTWPVTFSIALSGMVGADSLLYVFGRKLRAHSLRRKYIRRFIRPGRLRLATRWFARFGDRLIFVSRLVPGTRLVVFVSAGVRGIPYGRFLLYETSGAILWALMLLWLGKGLGERIGGVEAAIEWVTDRVLWVILLALVAVILRQLWGSRAQRKAPGDGL